MTLAVRASSGPTLSPLARSVADVGAKKTLDQARAGSRNLRFRQVAHLVKELGFTLARVSGSHHIFAHPLVPELVNLQSVDGQCKPYQVRQVLSLIDRYNLKLEAKT